MSEERKTGFSNWGEVVFKRDQRRYPNIQSIKVDNLKQILDLYSSGELSIPDISITDIDGVGIPTIGEWLLGMKKRTHSGLQLRQWARIERQAATVIVFSSRFIRSHSSLGISKFPFIGEEEKKRLAYLFHKTPEEDFFYFRKGLIRQTNAVSRIQQIVERVKRDNVHAKVHFLGSSALDFRLATKLNVDVFLSTHHLII